MTNIEKWKGLTVLIDGDIDKLLEELDSNNLIFAPSDESVDVEDWKENKNLRDELYASAKFMGPILTELLLYGSSIATIASFILDYFRKTKREKIILKKGDASLEIYGNYTTEEITNALKGFVTVTTNKDINSTRLKAIAKLRNEISLLEGYIKEYQEIYDAIKEKRPDRIYRYEDRINKWKHRIELYEKTIDDLTS
ncbi:MAG: hypothetical protein ACTSQY_06310 [Candidatus Odinarchaeia archaeon]